MNILQKTTLTLAAFSASAAPAMAQEAEGLDARVNEAFAAFTSPFVNLIFAPFPKTEFPWIVMWLVVAATFRRWPRRSRARSVWGISRASRWLSASAARGPRSG